MKNPNFNFITQSKSLALALTACILAPILFTPNIVLAQTARSVQVKPSIAPAPPSVQNQDVRSNAGFIAPGMAQGAPATTIMPVESNYYGQSVPQNYADWVEHYKLKYASLNCPSQKCILQGQIEIAKSASNYTVTLSGYSYSNNQKLILPSAYDEKSRKVWPSSVDISNNGKPYSAQAISENLDTTVILNKGDWKIIQTFDSASISFLDTKGSYAIYSNKSGESVDYNYDAQKLSFNKSAPIVPNSSSKSEVQLSAKVYRLYSESRPALLQTQVQITYFGPSQEVKLGKIIPNDFALSSYTSPVPLRLDKETQDYYAFLNPGNWTIYLNANTQKEITSIKVQDLVLINSSKSEIWSVSTQPTIRQFEVLTLNQKSATAVDPKISYVPGEWIGFNAYRIESEINFKTVNKASSEGDENSLKTVVNNRTTWIGLDSRAIHKEEITISNDKNIDVARLNSSVKVETALSQEKPQLIFKDKDRSAISIMPGVNQFKLLTSSSNDIPLSNIDNSQVNKINNWEIMLAPRTRLFSYSGADYIAGSWVNNWNLYAVFGLFLITLSFYKLFGWPSSIICFIGIAVNVHNSFLAWTVWPSILICMALIKVLSREREKEKDKEKLLAPSSPLPSSNQLLEGSPLVEPPPSEPIIVTPASNKLQTFLRFALFGLLVSMAAYSTALTINELRKIINPSLEADNFYVNENYLSSAPGMAPRKVMNRGSFNAKSEDVAGQGIDGNLAQEATIASAPAMAPAPIEAINRAQVDKETLEVNQTQAIQSKNQVSSGVPQWSGNSHRVSISNVSSQDVLSLYIAPVWLVNIMGLVQVFVAWLICAFMLSFILFNNLFTPPAFLNLEKYFLYSKYAKKAWPKKS